MLSCKTAAVQSEQPLFVWDLSMPHSRKIPAVDLADDPAKIYDRKRGIRMKLSAGQYRRKRPEKRIGRPLPAGKGRLSEDFPKQKSGDERKLVL